MAQAPEILRPDAAGIARAAALLARGRLVGLPPETVYGLAADATDERAVAAVFAAKGRPRFNPLIVHVPTVAAAEALARMTPVARALAAAFWPGPLTLVLPVDPGADLAPSVCAGLATVAVRVPAHPAMRSVLRDLGRPVAAPSANPSGRISATSAAHVVEDLGDGIAAVLDGGPSTIGLESAIVDPGPPARLLREGGLPREAIAAVAGPLRQDTTPGTVRAPGQSASHYAPRARLILDGAPPDGAVRIGFGPDDGGDVTLSATGDLAEAAARLFAALRAADALARARGADAIHVEPVPETGLGRAINDRLRRAAAPRS